MAFQRLVHAMSVNDLFLSALVSVDNSFLLVNEANLHCAVAVVLNRLDLRYHAGTCLKNGNRNQCAVFRENLGHSDLSSQNCLVHECLPPCVLHSGTELSRGLRQPLPFKVREECGMHSSANRFHLECGKNAVRILRQIALQFAVHTSL